MLELCPSILSSDFLSLKNNIKKLEKTKIKYIHLDVMDGHFVNNITIGPDIVNSISKSTSLILDVHLMISNPLYYIMNFINIGIYNITFHCEVNNNIKKIIEILKKNKCNICIAINPKTNFKDVLPYLKYLDMVLIMTVDPGFGNQLLKKDCIEKIYNLKKIIINNKLNCKIQVDGGINLDNINDVINAGADNIVVGSAIFFNNKIIKNTKIFLKKIKGLN